MFSQLIRLNAPIMAFVAGATVCLAVFADRGFAVEHPVSVIKAKAFIDPDGMTVSYEVVYADDLQLFQGLVVDEETGLFDEDELEEAIEKHGKFLQKNINVVDVDGNVLKSNLINVIDIEVPEEGLPDGSLMNYSLMYTYQYRFKEPPRFLTFQHTIDDSEFQNPVEIDITLKQAGAAPPYPRFGLRFNEPQSRELKWNEGASATQAEIDDWLSKEVDPSTVGVEGFSSTYSFIYITDYEVRHELLIPLSSLETLMDFQNKDRLYLTVEEQEKIIPGIEELFLEGNPLEIDKVRVQPKIHSINFYDLRTRDFGLTAKRQKVSTINGRVGVILTYSTKGLADEVVIKWDLFCDAIKQIDSVIIAFEEVSRFTFARYKSAEHKAVDENVYVWKNPGLEQAPQPEPIQSYIDASNQTAALKRNVWYVALAFAALFGVAMVVARVWAAKRKWLGALTLMLFLGSVVLLGLVAIPKSYSSLVNAVGLTPKINEEQAADVFEKLHRNMFRAFDYHQEEFVYDALAASVDGPLLSELYLDIRKSLIIQSQGGAISHIDEVKYVGGELSEPIKGKTLEYPGFAFRCRWDLVGSVEHWAHVHQRTNHYEAIFHVEIIDNEWKITDQQIVDESAGGVKQWRRRVTKKSSP